MGGREPAETRELISVANERTLDRLVSSRSEMVAGFLAFASELRRSWLLALLVLRTVNKPVYLSEKCAVKRSAIARPMPPAAPVTINVPWDFSILGFFLSLV